MAKDHAQALKGTVAIEFSSLPSHYWRTPYDRDAWFDRTNGICSSRHIWPSWGRLIQRSVPQCGGVSAMGSQDRQPDKR